ncbi:MAG TPA: anthranilate synthase component II, partial [Gordonia sp. (in: high G+C Gram-positive bacteria)]|nr:anthranilate synthase component II [Gordonia sp. (in: high G+C Gram-positive bacteria)]
MSGRILVIDNYDSFVYNLVQYLGQLSVETVVWRNDEAALGTDDAAYEAAIAEFDGVLLSPGPGTPQRAGATMP